ncbi:MAG TPA: hypothetical protein VM389_12360 [Phycisphaerae bacterium]|nr:hypothetical protein [Phycisphaerae bacterium]
MAAVWAAPAFAQGRDRPEADPNNIETLLDWARIVKGPSRGKLLDAVVVRVALDARTGHTAANAARWRSVERAAADMSRSNDPEDRLFVGRIRLLIGSAYVVDGGSENIGKGQALFNQVGKEPRSTETIVVRARALHAVAALLEPADGDAQRDRDREAWRTDATGLLGAVRRLYARTGEPAGLDLLRAARKAIVPLLPERPAPPREDGRGAADDAIAARRQEAEGVVASAVDSFLAAIEAILVVDQLTARRLAEHQESIRRYRIPPLVSRPFRAALDAKVGRVAADSAFALWLKAPHSGVQATQLSRSFDLLGADKTNADRYGQALLGAWQVDRAHRTGRGYADGKDLSEALAPHAVQLDRLRIADPPLLDRPKAPVELYLQALLAAYGPDRSTAALTALGQRKWEDDPTHRTLRRATEYHLLRRDLDGSAGAGLAFWNERRTRATALLEAVQGTRDPDDTCAVVYRQLVERTTAGLTHAVGERIAPPIGKEKITLAAEYAALLPPEALMALLESAVGQERLLGDPVARASLLKLSERVNQAVPGKADEVRKLLTEVPQAVDERVAYYYRAGQFDRCREAVEREHAQQKRIAPEMLLLGAAARGQEDWDQAPSVQELARRVAAWIVAVKPTAGTPYADLRDLSGLSDGTADRRDMVVALLYHARPNRPAGDPEKIIAACDRALQGADHSATAPARAQPLKHLIGREGEITARLQALLRVHLARTLSGEDRAKAMKAAAETVLPDPDSKRGGLFYGEGFAGRVPPLVRSELAEAAYEGRLWSHAAAVYALDLPAIGAGKKLTAEQVETYRRWLECRVHSRGGADPRRIPGLVRDEVKQTRTMVADKAFANGLDPVRRAAADLIWDDAPAATAAPANARLYRQMITRTAEVRLGGEEGNFNEWGPLRRDAGINRYASLWCFAVIWPNTSGYGLGWAYRGNDWPRPLQQWVQSTVEGKPEPLEHFDKLVASWSEQAAKRPGAGPSPRDIRAEAYLMRYLLHRDGASLNRAVATFAFGNPEYSLAVQLAGKTARRGE